ncbi:MAG: hypothetical protein ACQEP1_04035 [Nanobdellota archaeon]
MAEFKENYDKLKEKYSLPDYEELDQDFEIGAPEDSNILRAVRKRMADKLEQNVRFLEELVQPESTFTNMYEVKDFTEKDKNSLLALFKRLMILYRETAKLNLNLGEEKDASFIKNFHKEWKKSRKEIIYFVDKVQDTWAKDEQSDFHQEYFG